VSSTSSTTPTQEFVLEVKGTGFEKIPDLSNVYIAVMPATGVTPNPVPMLSLSQDKSKILAEFTAPAGYALEEIALSTGSAPLPYPVGASSCDFNSKVKLVPQMVPKSQAGNKYGNGVAKNFYAVQISIVNECPMAIIVPLAGISMVAGSVAATGPTGAVPSPAGPTANTTAPDTQTTGASGTTGQTKTDRDCSDEDDTLVAFSLDHVTSIFSADRKLTGRRVVYFNTLQALATIGSAIDRFLASGFAKGVAIFGGGFTTASKEILVDMSAEQLQNLTSQSFGATEQVASHGSLQKFVFVRRSERCKNSVIGRDFRTGKFVVAYQLSPASAAAPTTQTAAAKQTAATKTTTQ
jgi:hypothetical protein